MQVDIFEIVSCLKFFKNLLFINILFVTVKIIIQEKKIVIDEQLEDCSVEELQDELPERQPRYPLCFDNS